MPADADTGSDALAVEALRVNARYLEEVVLGWGLCPWAERALRDGRVRRRVIDGERPAAAAVLALIDEMATDADADIGLCLFPRATLGAAAFDSFAEQVRRADRARGSSAFMLAAFHPDGAATFATAPQAVSFLRRTPDPTLQIVRAELLARVADDVSATVGRQNFATITARGPAVLDALLRDIRRDRDQAYARLRL